MNIPVDRTEMPRLDAEAVRAGKVAGVPSDHMFISEYAHGEWRKSRIQAYRPIPISPFAIGMQYAQSVFEGMKAYRYQDGRIAVFRIERNAERFNRSLERMCMPTVPVELFREAIVQLVAVDHQWVPEVPDVTLYIRPYMFAHEEHVGLQPAKEFLFMVLTAPFSPRFNKSIRVKVEREFVRAAPGGVGYAKCAGNYAAAMYPTQLAKEQGFDQLIWTDALTHTRVEESGAMNVMFVIDGAVVTPPLSDTILDGVTRESLLILAKDAGLTVQERAVTVDELREGIPSGRVTEAFGAGTAAIVAPIGIINIDGVDYTLPTVADPVTMRLKKMLDDIRTGVVEDRHHWMTIVEPRG